MKTAKRALSLLLSLMLVLGTVSVGGISAAAAETYNLWVGGVRVTSENKSGDGWSYEGDGTSGTLTLNNATISGAYNDARIFSSVLNLTIVFVGNNVLSEGAGGGILTYNGGNLKVTGNGTLDVSAEIYAINSDGTLTIENVSVDAKVSNSYAINSVGTLTIENASVVAKSNGAYSINSNGNMTIENASVVATSNGYYSIDCESVLTITNSYVSAESTGICICGDSLILDKVAITEPDGGQNNGKMITLNNQYVKKAVIQPAYSVELSANPSGGGTVSGSGFYAKNGSTATVTATPNEHYNFVNWTENGDEVSTDAEYSFTVSGDRELVANFEIEKFIVQFVNDDGTELQSSPVAYGETPVYTGETPTKEATAEYTYTFAGWSPEISEVTGDTTYTATYTKAPREYEIKFVNEDGAELQSGPVAYGETPAYTGEEPTKQATAEYTYTFAGWSPEISEVTGDTTYTATYTETPVDYTLKFCVDGEVYKESTVPFGTAITGPEDPVKDYYTFAGWDKEIPATMPAEDVTINGSFTPVEYTATFVDENGKTVEAVKFTVETDSIKEPAVPEKAGYTGEWEKYTLGTSDITIKPVYENITSIQLENYEENSETGYKEDKTFTAKADDLPEGAEIHWYVNGEDVATGESYTVEDPTDDYNIYAEVIDKDGNTLDTTKIQSVKVRNGFFDRLKAFFSELIEKILGKAIADLLSSVC